ncbi:MAG: HD domain-containing protein, partial [Planctomycetes bacterium]|nr:HD domain-containing protein [Planctomycetota bacterium]
VVDIGASAVRMAIAEITEDGPVRTLENLTQAVSLGKDTFTKGSIDSATTEDCVRVLKSYREKLNEFGITDRNQIHVVATSAVREATNRLSFLKRIYVATGFRVEPFDEAAVNRVTFLGVRPLFQSRPELANGRTLIVEVGGGSTEVLLFQDGDVAYAHTFRLGSLRLRRTLEAYHAPMAKVRKIMESQIQRSISAIQQRVLRDQPMKLIALGGDVRFAVEELGEASDDCGLATLKLKKLKELTDRILARTAEEVARDYHLAFTDAEAAGPALLTYVQLASLLGLDQIQVSNINLRDGLIKEMALHEAWTADFVHQIIRSAVDFGRRFGFDETHGKHVAELSRALFRALEHEHGLTSRHEVILYIGALLHDLGYAVNARSHHKHSMYLILNGELFGLSKRDTTLAALTARYHRRSTPKPTHQLYSSLEWESRTNVAKMAAILRVADALDRSNSQRVRDIRCSIEGGTLVITVPTADDLSLEQLALKQKAKMFTEIFGMPVVLQNATEM